MPSPHSRAHRTPLHNGNGRGERHAEGEASGLDTMVSPGVGAVVISRDSVVVTSDLGRRVSSGTGGMITSGVTSRVGVVVTSGVGGRVGLFQRLCCNYF